LARIELPGQGLSTVFWGALDAPKRRLGVDALGFGGFSPPCQQGDGGDEQTQESDFLHVLDGMLHA
jgi:hypothetical protein